MATIGATALTYADWAKRMDDGYHVAVIIELLSQTNEILDDMLVVEGNLPTGHKTTVRTGLPQATWRLLNTGVPNAKSTTAQIVDTWKRTPSSTRMWRTLMVTPLTSDSLKLKPFLRE